MSDSFIKKIQDFSFHNELFQEGDSILIGISGGSDSVCLTSVFLRLKEKHNLEIALLHVNYGLRGEGSDKDEEFVRNFADKNNLPLKVVKYNARQGKSANEELMRDFRYKEFEKERQEKKLKLIAVGHTLDDQVETFVMNVMRGSGLRGLSGISAKRDCIIRPLLTREKKEVVAWLESIEQDYRVDQSNFEPDFTRNKVRSSLIPLVVEEFNPNFKKSVSRLVNNVERANEVVDECTEKTYNDIVEEGASGELLVELDEFNNLSVGLQSFLFRRVVAQLMGDLDELSEAHFFEFLKILRSQKSKIQKYEFLSIIIERRGNEIKFVSRKK